MVKNSKYYLIIAVFVFFSLTTVLSYIFWPQLKDIYSRLAPGLQKVQELSVDVANELKKNISVPPPMIGEESGSASSYLTVGGVLDETNRMRQENGLAILAHNELLDKAAKAKLDDMFNKQYFEHVSPDGRGVDALAADAGYNYKMLGENLALGDYENDQVLVQAWMESPGHRENILKPEFTELGVAVGQGEYEGKEVWMAVQEFGTPMPVCPPVDQSLKAKLENAQKELDILVADLKERKAAIDSTRPKNSPALKAAMEEYNSLVEQYNNGIAELKVMVSEYNKSVEVYNKCIG